MLVFPVQLVVVDPVVQAVVVVVLVLVVLQVVAILDSEIYDKVVNNIKLHVYEHEFIKILILTPDALNFRVQKVETEVAVEVAQKQVLQIIVGNQLMKLQKN